MAAHREAAQGSPWNPFAHSRTRTTSLPQTWQASNELEGQPLTPAHTAPLPPPSSGSDGHETVVTHPEPGESSTHLHKRDVASRDPLASDMGPATVTQGVLRRRTSGGRDPSPNTTAERAPEAEEPKKSRTFFKHLTPKEPFTVRNQLQRTLFNSWINILLVAAPAGIAINYVHSVSRIAVFIVNFIAIVPLAAMLGFATEEIALRTGETVGGLLNATFGYVFSSPRFGWGAY